MERHCTITTPQNVSFAFRLAGIPSRALAWLLDMVFMGCAVLLGWMVMLAIWGGLSLELAMAATFLVFFTVSFGYTVFFEVLWNGQTPGKRILGLRVIRDDGTVLDFRASVIRNLLRLFDGFPQPGPVQTMLLGAVVAGCSERGKRLGDWAAETMVVQVGRRRVPQGFQATRGAYNTLRENRSLVARIRREITLGERELLIDLCVRSDEIELRHRAQLFDEAAEHLCAILGFELPEHMSAEKLVQNVTDVLLDEDGVGAGANLPGALGA